MAVHFPAQAQSVRACSLPLGGAGFAQQRLRGYPREPTPPVAYGDSPLWDGALGMAGKFPAKVQSARTRQRLPPRGSCQSRQALTEGVQPACAKQCLLPQRRAFAESGVASAASLHDPSRENGIAERPQALRYPEIINNLSAEDVQSAAEHIQNRPQTHDRPAQGSKLHRAVMCKKEDRSLLCRKHRRVARIKESI